MQPLQMKLRTTYVHMTAIINFGQSFTWSSKTGYKLSNIKYIEAPTLREGRGGEGFKHVNNFNSVEVACRCGDARLQAFRNLNYCKCTVDLYFIDIYYGDQVFVITSVE